MNGKGQDLVGYALVVAILAATAAGMTALAVEVNRVFTYIGMKLTAYTR
jgi:hypothetical protein